MGFYCTVLQRYTHTHTHTHTHARTHTHTHTHTHHTHTHTTHTHTHTHTPTTHTHTHTNRAENLALTVQIDKQPSQILTDDTVYHCLGSIGIHYCLPCTYKGKHSSTPNNSQYRVLPFNVAYQQEECSSCMCTAFEIKFRHSLPGNQKTTAFNCKRLLQPGCRTVLVLTPSTVGYQAMKSGSRK